MRLGKRHDLRQEMPTTLSRQVHSHCIPHRTEQFHSGYHIFIFDGLLLHALAISQRTTPTTGYSLAVLGTESAHSDRILSDMHDLNLDGSSEKRFTPPSRLRLRLLSPVHDHGLTRG